MEKIDLLSLTLEEVENLIVSLGEKKFRGKQIFQWVKKEAIPNENQLQRIDRKGLLHTGAGLGDLQRRWV